MKYLGYQSRSLSGIKNALYVGHILSNELGKMLLNLGYHYRCRSFVFHVHTCWCRKRKGSALWNHSCLTCAIRKHLLFCKLASDICIPSSLRLQVHLKKSQDICFLPQRHPSYLSLAGLLCPSQPLSVPSPPLHFQPYFRKPWTTMYPGSRQSLLDVYGAFWLGTQVALCFEFENNDFISCMRWLTFDHRGPGNNHIRDEKSFSDLE